jgi:GWxTD domain-containing protein
MMMIKKIVFGAILLCGAFVLAEQTITWKDLQNNIDEWAKGPVSLILTDQESQIFEKLKTPEEKMQFIKIFWARRDPILRTRANEFKEEFYKRVDYGNQNFAEKDTSGWKTARGQAYIMFGPPSRVDHQTIADSSRPALLWVYDKLLSKPIPPNEALMFVWRDFKYVLVPPNPEDAISAQQAALDRNFRYQTIPSAVQRAFADVSQKNVIDEKKNYNELLYSVRSTEKFGIASVNFDTRMLKSHPAQLQVIIPADKAPVYDDGNRTFAELVITQELKQGDRVVTRSEKTESYNWGSEAFSNLKQIIINLPSLQAPPGQYELFITVQDRISAVGETKKVPFAL